MFGLSVRPFLCSVRPPVRPFVFMFCPSVLLFSVCLSIFPFVCPFYACMYECPFGHSPVRFHARISAQTVVYLGGYKFGQLDTEVFIFVSK